MARLCLRLENDDGSYREYKKEKIKAYWVKEAMKHSKEVSALERKGDPVAVLEARLKFVCEVFGGKELTPDAILNGLEANELFPKLDEIFSTLLGDDVEDREPGKQ